MSSRRKKALQFIIIISLAQLVIYIHIVQVTHDHDPWNSPPERDLHSQGSSLLLLNVSEIGNYHIRQMGCAGISTGQMNSSVTELWRKKLKAALAIPKMQWLPNYRSPCANVVVENTIEVEKINKTCKNVTKPSVPRHISCLPYVYIAGMPKCGTTDFFHCLRKHPHVFSSKYKEPEWWARRLAGDNYMSSHVYVSWKWYFSMFAGPSRCIQDIADHHSFHPAVAVDASSSTFWELNRWPLYPGNDDVMAPSVTTAHLIADVTPNVKIIVLFRNPTDRVYSHYYHRCHVENVTECDEMQFHRQAMISINDFTKCQKSRSDRECVYDSCLHALGNRHRQVSIRGGLYVHFVEEWLKVFPQKQLHFIHYESYIKNRTSDLKDAIDFIGLDPLSDETLSEISRKPPSNTRKAAFSERSDMLQMTRVKLDLFYAPFNKALSRLLEDDRYRWHVPQTRGHISVNTDDPHANIDDNIPRTHRN